MPELPPEHLLSIYQALHALVIDVADLVERKLELLLDELEDREIQLDLPLESDHATSPDIRAF